uniref:WGS project CBMI000000000 data, contig CS3069_c003143 n=1 Tax=Fusarium clavum TaxID=2594811 RepID=A0A090MDD9_9HYPO|nr:unnamed protein product [Fusarium clavum]
MLRQVYFMLGQYLDHRLDDTSQSLIQAVAHRQVMGPRNPVDTPREKTPEKTTRLCSKMELDTYNRSCWTCDPANQGGTDSAPRSKTFTTTKVLTRLNHPEEAAEEVAAVARILLEHNTATQPEEEGCYEASKEKTLEKATFQRTILKYTFQV